VQTCFEESVVGVQTAFEYFSSGQALGLREAKMAVIATVNLDSFVDQGIHHFECLVSYHYRCRS